MKKEDYPLPEQYEQFFPDMEKHYVPDPSEFHIGFEYRLEIDIFDMYGNRGWSNVVMDRLTRSTSPSLVKYLDRQDIESLGWYYKNTSEEGYEYFLSFNLIHSILYSMKLKQAVITIWDEEKEEDYTAFVGYVKNKSELKKLIQQLGIS